MDMQPDVKITNLNLHKGHRVEVRGHISKDSSRFAVDLGTDCNNLICHCNPRFEFSVDKNTIIFNSKENDVWGTEQKEVAFPFKAGSQTMLIFEFGDCINVHLPDGTDIPFACRFPIQVINYLALYNLQLISISVH
ncbi:hypothetical protein XELAEV_18025711mg [Xenopus laevis]|uniref:Galectin n=2 Tax=Xenopus laevis TaxID=8355 RepID=B7ZQL7_XENLA|nr:Galectin family xgalectin-Vb [Xenopus laevis]AAI69857.1 Galectin family xgalectin-Vb [Xenopus laevis]OCT83174.1 hypothetical protein XELAEV_18025711mg [Xenopus laevis]